jgi:rhodanese-related sulfurtransferase
MGNQHYTSEVLRVAPADPDVARRHFAARLALETDPDELAEDLRRGALPYAVVDARDAEAYATAHVPGAHSLPYDTTEDEGLDGLPAGPAIVYSWGPGCNAAVQIAARLAARGRPVKEVLGGFDDWLRKGHPVEEGPERSERAPGSGHNGDRSAPAIPDEASAG